MEVRIIRGRDKIGENLIEISDGRRRILLECGVALERTEQTDGIELEILKTEYDAVIVTHYHRDHCGMLKFPLRTKAVYLGFAAYGVLEYCNAICAENRSKIRFLQSEISFFVGEIECVPYLCDHSAYDSYALALKQKDETVLYTGDFRSNGRKDFQSFLGKLPQKVNRLIVEGTNPAPKNIAERDVEAQATELFEKYAKVFVLQSVLNVDRTVSFYRASKRAGKPFFMRLSAAEIYRSMPNIPEPVRFFDCFTYLSTPVSPSRRAELKTAFGGKLIGREAIANTPKFTMQVHAGMLSYLQKAAKLRPLKGALLVYSIWGGYKTENAEMYAFLSGVQDLGIETVDLHASGHADVETVKALLARTNPDRVDLVHTRAADRDVWAKGLGLERR